MARSGNRTGVFHHVGTFFLLAATVLLLITTIAAPVVNHIPILKVKLQNDSAVSFGTFGYCILDAAETNDSGDWCTGKHIGYNPGRLMEQIDGADYNDAGVTTAKGLTRVMVLHPIATGLAFISFLLALGAGIVGSILAGIVAAITWIITLVVMATDFTAFGIVKNKVNGDKSGSHAYYSTGMWTILAAMICLFLGMIIVLFTCLSARMHKKRAVTKTEYVDTTPAVAPRRHFWQRRTRY